MLHRTGGGGVLAGGWWGWLNRIDRVGDRFEKVELEARGERTLSMGTEAPGGSRSEPGVHIAPAGLNGERSLKLTS